MLFRSTNQETFMHTHHRLFGMLALGGLILSLATHLAALFGIAVAEYIPFTWLLHVGMFVVFLPFVLETRKTLGARPSMAQLRAVFPLWVMVVFVCLMIYVLCNFMLFIGATQGGAATIAENGQYVLMHRGQLLRALSKSEYLAFKANEVRGFSGHWLLFYFAPFAYFIFGKRGQNEIKKAD